jgi:hypothetical protein
MKDCFAYSLLSCIRLEDGTIQMCLFAVENLDIDGMWRDAKEGRREGGMSEGGKEGRRDEWRREGGRRQGGWR